MATFVDRENELAALEEEYARDGASFVVVYGRRRIGKTALLERFMQDKRGVYFLATEESESVNRSSFKDVVARELGNSLLAAAHVDRWEDVFSVIADSSREGRMVIVIDEFQYLGKASAAFPSVLQRIWDSSLKDCDVMLVLCGSLIRMMHAQALSYDSPLYGRRTASMKMRQIPFEHYRAFFPDASDRQLVERYSVTGGVPKYVEQFSAGADIYRSIEKRVLNRASFLYDEPGYLLSSEVGEVGTYYSIMRAIAAGNHKPGKIAAALEVNQTSLSKYLGVLIELDLVRREVPATEKNPEKSKRGRYYLADNFMRFWFRFVLPNVSYIESGHAEVAADAIRANFVDGHAAYVYEDVCREKAWSLSASGVLPFALDRVGRWWDDRHAEIDVLGIGEEGAFIGECKFWKGSVGANVLRDLEKKARYLGIEAPSRVYAIFSIAGFTQDLKDIAKERDDVLLVEGA